MEPRETDFALYCERSLIERFFNTIKNFRAIATRYDKLANTFLAAIHLAASLIASNDDTPLPLRRARRRLSPQRACRPGLKQRRMPQSQVNAAIHAVQRRHQSGHHRRGGPGTAGRDGGFAGACSDRPSMTQLIDPIVLAPYCT